MKVLFNIVKFFRWEKVVSMWRLVVVFRTRWPPIWERFLDDAHCLTWRVCCSHAKKWISSSEEKNGIKFWSKKTSHYVDFSWLYFDCGLLYKHQRKHPSFSTCFGRIHCDWSSENSFRKAFKNLEKKSLPILMNMIRLLSAERF